MYKVVFIFSSPPQKIEEEFERGTDISTMKFILLTDLWPLGQMEKSHVSGLRFFSMGKELPNSLKIEDIKMINSSSPVPILVHVVKGDSEMGGEKNDCDCATCRVI